jgi:K+-transporting ATPase ATPase C chain
MSSLPGWLRQHLAALRALIVLTVVLGVAYPLAITAVAQVIAPTKANGSHITVNGTTVGSSLLAQSFDDDKKNPLPQWFQPRPSAGSWDPSASGATNLGPENADLIAAITKVKVSVAAFDSVPRHTVAPADVPADAVTSSGSGLDPHISVAYAEQQAYRVAATRKLDPGRVLALVTDHTEHPVAWIFGTEVVNVLRLNIALATLS